MARLLAAALEGEVVLRKSRLRLLQPRLRRFSVAAAAALCFTGCAHVTSYYEANFEGTPPLTDMGCYGPSSSTTFMLASGISVMADAYRGGRRVRIEVHARDGGKFAFTSGLVTLRSVEFSGPIRVSMEDFTADYHEGAVASPTADLFIKRNRRFDTNISVPTEAKEFYLQLPDALVNGTLTSFPRIHFKRAVKAYIGVCEA